MHGVTLSRVRNVGCRARFLSRLLAAISSHSAYRKTLRELHSLSDRQLEDLGLSRDTLQKVALQAAGATRT